jgi:hypothetical protein
MPAKIEVRAPINELFELQNYNKSLDKPRKLINKAKISASDEVIALLPSHEALRQRLATRCNKNIDTQQKIIKHSSK